MPDDDRIAMLARALGHPARVRIVKLLAAQSECRGSDVFGELPLAQSTVSGHLRVLKDAGIVSARADGTAMVYCVRPEVLAELGTALHDIAWEAPSCATATPEPIPSESRKACR